MVKLRDFVRELGCVVVPRLGRRRSGVGGRKPSGCRRRSAQCVRRGTVALPVVLLPVLLVQKVGLRVVGEVRPVKNPLNHLLDGGIPSAGIGGCVLIGEVAKVLLRVPQVCNVVVISGAGVGGRAPILEVYRGHHVLDKASAVSAAGVSAPGTSQLLRASVGRRAVCVGGGVVVPLLVVQDRHPEIRVALRPLQVSLGELVEEPAALRVLSEIFIGISSHWNLLSTVCRAGFSVRCRCSSPAPGSTSATRRFR